MTDPEFKAWFAHLRSSFSRLETRLKEPQAARVLYKAWRESLREVSPEDAQAYVQRMVDGSAFVPEWPSDWDAFPSMVRGWARDEAKRREPPPPRKRSVDPTRQQVYREALRSAAQPWLRDLAARLDREDPLPAAP